MFYNMKINLFFLIKLIDLDSFLKKKNKTTTPPQTNFLIKGVLKHKPIKLTKKFLKKSISILKFSQFMRFKNRYNFFFFINRFILFFVEFFFKKKVIFNLKKGTNKLLLKQISFRKFSIKYFKKNLKVSKQILGILYYSFLLKDSSIFVIYFKNVLERINIKLHKKIFIGLKKLIKDFFKPIFNFLGLLGVFFNIKGKIGVSGSAKKRRYYFYFGKHSITSRSIKFDLKFSPIWTFTGSLGFNFLIFF